MAGLTGSILAFNHELDEWLNPEFYSASADGQRLPPGTLVDKLQAEHPRLQVWYMEYPSEPGHTALLAAVPRNDPATGKTFCRAQSGVLSGPGQWRAERAAVLGRVLLSAGELHPVHS
ncbi:PepSY domain-containing protein [Pseudomonas lini]